MDGLHVSGKNFRFKAGDISLEILSNERRTYGIKDLKSKVLGITWEWKF
jgi:hypothetical protein